jgi:hypothetical protein
VRAGEWEEEGELYPSNETLLLRLQWMLHMRDLECGL